MFLKKSICFGCNQQNMTELAFEKEKCVTACHNYLYCSNTVKRERGRSKEIKYYDTVGFILYKNEYMQYKRNVYSLSN